MATVICEVYDSDDKWSFNVSGKQDEWHKIMKRNPSHLRDEQNSVALASDKDEKPLLISSCLIV